MDKMMIALNKVDLFPPEEKESSISKAIERLRTRFSFTKFGKDLPIVPVTGVPPSGIETLIQTILENLELPERRVKDQPFLFSIDHCFQIKGQGTVLTGTVLRG